MTEKGEEMGVGGGRAGERESYLNDMCVEALGRGLHSTACNVLFYRL